MNVLAVAVFGDERQRRRDLPGREAAELLGRVLDELAVEAQHVARVLDLEEHRAAVDVLDRVQAELERRDDAEVPAAAAQRPEEILVLPLRCAATRLPVGGDDLRRDEVVAREADAARQVADAAAEREPADAGRGDDASGRREAVGVRRVVEVAPRGAALGASCSRFGIDLHVRHPGEVDDHARRRRCRSRERCDRRREPPRSSPFSRA